MMDLARLQIEVWDDLSEARGTPTVHRASPDEESGWGLQLVETLSKDWGWEQVPGCQAKRVWALLTIS